MKERFEVYAPNMKAFIVPNSLNKVSGFYDGERRMEYLNEIGGINNWPKVTEDTWLVELWFHDKEDLHTDNLTCHGSSINYNGESCHMSVDTKFEFLPIDLFIDKKEGDKIHIDLPNEIWRRCRSEGGEESPVEASIPVMIHMDVELKQIGYRYARFGTFDQVLEKLKINAGA